MDAKKIMLQALRLAEKGKGQVSPNPLVGCIIVKNKQIVGEGYHQKFGGPHAEINALAKAGKLAKGAELYVTLEPCCHVGKTPPCTEAILNAGIQKVFIAIPDPNPLMAGKGIDFLKKHGIQIEIGQEKDKAEKINEVFLHYIKTKMPFVALKFATTLDGKITRNDGEKWITNQKARRYVHTLRSQYDAILVGKKTVLEDDPQLTTYLISRGKNPLRIILDTNLEIPLNQKVFTDPHFILVTKQGHPKEIIQKYIKKGGQILESGKNQIDLKKMLKELGKMKIASILVEGGAQVFTNFLNQNLAQKIYWFQAPLLTGENSLNSLGDLNLVQKLIKPTYRKFEDNLLITAKLL